MAEELKTYTITQNGLPFQVQLTPSTAKEMGLLDTKQAEVKDKKAAPANKASSPANKKTTTIKAKVEDVADEEDLV